MPRDLTQTNDNRLTIRDALSGDDVVLTYRTPTTEERVGYQKELVKRTGTVITMRIPETQLKYGSAILTGIRRGDFIADGELLSSQPDEDGFRPDWKELIIATAGDLLMILGRQIFEGSAPQAAPVVTFADEVDGEAFVPLELTSND